MTDRAFDLEAYLDRQPLSLQHIKILVLLTLTMLLDGYDIFAVGYVLPVLAKGLKVAPSALTTVLVLQQFALLFGVIITGPLADRYGRKSILLISIVAFSICSLLTTQCHTLTSFTILRVISSVFFSGVIPNTVALAAEIAPKRFRSTAVTISFCGYTGGSFLGSFVQAFILKPFGWQGAFWIGGLAPLAIFVILLWQLPESLKFRALRDPRDPTIARTLRQLDPTIQLDGTEQFVLRTADPARRVSARNLFQGVFLITTLTLWLAYAMGFLVSQLLGSWNTTVLNTVGGIPMASLSVIIAASAAAGILGTILSGVMMDRFGPFRVLPLYFLGQAVTLVILSFSDVHSRAIILLFMASSFFNAGGLGGINALAAFLYPSRIRATGVAWASGAGRAGATVGPLVGGVLLAHHFGLTPIYLTVACPALLAAACLFGLSRFHRQHGDQAQAGLTIPTAEEAAI